MPEKTSIDSMYEHAGAIIGLLTRNSEFSLQISAADNFRKALLLAAASYFEHRICDSIIEFVRERAGGSLLVENFVKNKAIARQYHTWFDWERDNANSFFALFGNEFKTAMTARIGASEETKQAISAFMEVGSERNRLVHQNYASFPMEKTIEEIYSLYQRASVFVDSLPAALRECDLPRRPA